MEMRKLIREAGETALDVDDCTHRLFKPYAETRGVAALHPLSKLGDQPALRTISAGLILAGIVLRSHRMARAGSRMAACVPAITARMKRFTASGLAAAKAGLTMTAKP